MKFDKTKVQTVVTADNVKIGSKGYFGDLPSEIEMKVKKEEKPAKLVGIKDLVFPFISEDGKNYTLFYPVEEVAEENAEEKSSKCIKKEKAALEVIKELEKKCGGKKKAVLHCAEKTIEIKDRLVKIAEDIQSLFRENEEVAGLGGLSVVFGFRIDDFQIFTEGIGGGMSLSQNLLELTKDIISNIKE